MLPITSGPSWPRPPLFASTSEPASVESETSPFEITNAISMSPKVCVMNTP